MAKTLKDILTPAELAHAEKLRGKKISTFGEADRAFAEAIRMKYQAAKEQAALLDTWVGKGKQAVDTLQARAKQNIAAIPNLPQEAAEGAKKAVAYARTPEAQATALRYGLPIAAGAASGGLGFIPAVGTAFVAGAGGEGLAQVREQLGGVSAAPQTTEEAATRMGTEGVWNALGEGVGRGLLGGAKWLKNKIVDFTAGKASQRSAGATASELSRIYNMHPEVMKPEYFNERSGAFIKDVPKKVGAALEKSGQTLEKALVKEGNAKVMRVTDLQRAVDDSLSKLSAIQTPDAADAIRKVQDLAADLASKNPVDPLLQRGGDVTARDLVKFEKDMWDLTKKGGPNVRDAMGSLRNSLDTALSGQKKITAARSAYKEYRQAADVVEDFLGASPKASPADIAPKLHTLAQNYLDLPYEVQQHIAKGLNTIDPSGELLERLEKLAAAGGGSGRLTGSQPVLPTLGMGNIGWSLANPQAAAGALGATAAVRGATNSPVLRGLAGAALSSPVKKVLLPGLDQAAQLVRIGRMAKELSDQRKAK